MKVFKTKVLKYKLFLYLDTYFIEMTHTSQYEFVDYNDNVMFSCLLYILKPHIYKNFKVKFLKKGG